LTMLFAGCLWQSRALLDVLNRPLKTVSTASGALADRSGQAPVRAALARSGQAFEQLSRSTTLSGADRRAAGTAAGSLAAAARELGHPAAKKPITIGLGEPFSTSVTVAFAFALILALPLLLWQAWGFLSPAVGAARQPPR